MNDSRSWKIKTFNWNSCVQSMATKQDYLQFHIMLEEYWKTESCAVVQIADQIDKRADFTNIVHVTSTKYTCSHPQ